MMWPYYASSWSWLWMTVMMVVVWGGLVALVVTAIRTYSGRRPTLDQPLEILRRRLAAGEITPEEYETTRKMLLG